MGKWIEKFAFLKSFAVTTKKWTREEEGETEMERPQCTLGVILCVLHFQKKVEKDNKRKAN